MTSNNYNLIIVGAGCTGREVLQYAKECIKEGQPISLRGFIDNNPDALKGYDVDVGVIGDDDYIPKTDDAFIITLQDSNVREKLASQLIDRGARMVSIIHPTAYIAPSAEIGPGCIIAPFVFIGVNACVEDNTLINVGAVVGHDAKIGEYSVLCPGATASGRSILEKKVFMGTNSVVVPGYKIGQGSKITAGSVVYKDMEENTMAFGNPAKMRTMFR